MLHQLRPLLPNRRHRASAPAATDPVVHDVRSACESLCRWAVACPAAPGRKLPPRPLPEPVRETAHRLGVGLSAARDGRGGSAIPRLAEATPANAANRDAILGARA